jgi:L-iditol 2-dehydrogenase
VLITDVSDFRLGKAKECGIEARVNVATSELAAAVREKLGEDKADVILECVGTGQTIAQAVAVARKGTDIIVVGVFGSPPVVDLGTVQDRELRLIGTLMYKEPDWKVAIDLIKAGKINLAPLVTDRFAFADYVKAYQYIDANRERAMKVMISLGD